MSNLGLTILGFSIIFISTTLGSALVFFFKKEVSGKINTLFLGFAAGIMIAASIWSLLVPSIEEGTNTYGSYGFIPAVIGFILGGLFLVIIDKIVPHFHKATNEEEGLKNHLKKPLKMFLAVTIHNIPEGLSVGFAFGAASIAGDHASFISALTLALGIAIQNFPEGAAVSLPLVRETQSKFKSFVYGTLSGVVEPIFAIVGYFLASSISIAQPWFLAFAAGAMIFVVVEDLIPETHLSEHPHLGTWGLMIGFALMMMLDVALG